MKFRYDNLHIMKRLLVFSFLIIFLSISGCSKTKRTTTASKGSSIVKKQANKQSDVIGSSQELKSTTNNSQTGKVVKVKLEPQFPTTVDDIKVDLPEDFAGEIDWYVNGEHLVGENDSVLESSYFKRGDTVKVVAIDDNGTKYIGETKIVNANPIITVNDSDFEVDDVLRYHIRASDPDGDPVKIEITEAPEGYSYDPNTKTLTIPIENKPGDYLITFKVKAVDPYGGWFEKTIAYRLLVSEEKVTVQPIR